jgi:hypothetical protein
MVRRPPRHPDRLEFSTVMAKGKDGGKSVTRRTYMLKLAGEILTGEPMESYSNSTWSAARSRKPRPARPTS